ncbi:MAG: hypothetical protein OEV66_12160 [Spirochaetia bacterium]|nr:hypothetical protein [Spirochaetia bacterium]
MKMTDTEIKIRGMKTLSKDLGLVEAERFISLIQRDRFDYTKWQQNLFENMTGDEISKQAMDYIQKTGK